MNKDYIGIKESSETTTEDIKIPYYAWLLFGIMFIVLLSFIVTNVYKKPPEYSKEFTLYLETTVGMFEFHPRYETSLRMMKQTNSFNVINFSIKKN